MQYRKRVHFLVLTELYQPFHLHLINIIVLNRVLILIAQLEIKVTHLIVYNFVLN